MISNTANALYLTTANWRPQDGTTTFSDVITSNVFTVSGFGPGDLVNPTAGSFTRTFTRRANGGYTVSGAGYGVYPFVYKGVLDGRVLQSFGSLPSWSNEQGAALLRNSCIAKLYDDIRNSDLNLATDTAERQESFDLAKKVKKPVNTLATGLKDLANDLSKRGVMGKGRAAAKRAADVWLAHKLALQPTADELDHLVHHELEKRLAQPVTVRARKSATNSGEDTTSILSGYTSQAVWSRRRTWVTSRRIEIKVTFNIVDPNFFDLTRIMPLNPFSLLWEVQPLSFVVDWAFNIGEFLASLEGALGLGLQFVRGYETTSSYMGEQYNYVCPTQIVQNGASQTGFGRGSRVTTTKQRIVLAGFPVPQLPRPRNPFHKLGTDRLLTSASLLAKLL